MLVCRSHTTDQTRPIPFTCCCCLCGYGQVNRASCIPNMANEMSTGAPCVYIAGPAAHLKMHRINYGQFSLIFNLKMSISFDAAGNNKWQNAANATRMTNCANDSETKKRKSEYAPGLSQRVVMVGQMQKQKK